MNPRRAARREIRLQKLHHDPHCLYCRRRLREWSSTIDHIVPVSQGGEDAPENLALCCVKCNACKDNRSLSQWISDLAQALSATIPPVRSINGKCPKPTR